MEWINNATGYVNAIYVLLTAISGALCFAIGIMRKISVKMEAVGGGLQSVLRNDIHGAYYKHMREGCCSVESRENVDKLHTYYKDLGGNGSVDRMVDEIMCLPTSL